MKLIFLQIIIRISLIFLIIFFILNWKESSCITIILIFLFLFGVIFREVFDYFLAKKFAILDGLFTKESMIKKLLSAKTIVLIQTFFASFILACIVMLSFSVIDNLLFLLSIFGIFLFFLITIFLKKIYNELNYGYLYAKKWVFIIFSITMVLIYSFLFGYLFEPIEEINFIEYIKTLTHDPIVNCQFLKELHVGALYMEDIKKWLFSIFFHKTQNSIFWIVFIFISLSLFTYFFSLSHIYSFILHVRTKQLPDKFRPGLFITTLLFLTLVTFVLYVSGFIKNSKIFDGKIKTTYIENSFRVVFGNENINIKKSEIPSILIYMQENRENILKNANEMIDKSLDDAFMNASTSIIDEMSSWYFSVLTDYALLISWAKDGNIDKKIVEKFEEIYKKHMPNLDENFLHVKEKIDENFSIYLSKAIKQYANDNKENSKISDEMLKNAIKTSFSNVSENSFNRLKISGFGASSLGILATLSTKSSFKLASKIATKTALKATAATTGGIGGSVCGPFAIICSPAFAIASWVGVDFAVTKIDETLNKEEFEHDLQDALNVGKDNLKIQMKDMITKYYEDIENILHAKLKMEE